MKRKLAILCAGILIGCLPFTAANAASAPGVFSGPFSAGTAGTLLSGNAIVGYEFSVSNPVTVTDLGWFDDGGDGLSQSHQVAIWDVNDTSMPLVSATVPAGISDLVDGFEYVSLGTDSMILSPGDYVIAGFVGTLDAYFGRVSGVTSTNFYVSYTEPRAILTNNLANLTYPDVTSADASGYFGPNLQVIPIPAAAWLFGSGLLGLIGIARMGKTG